MVELSNSVKLLGVTFDSPMTMQHRVGEICRSANYHLYKIGKIRHLLTESATVSAVRTLVISRLDYCNGLLFGVPSNLLNRVQLVQNSAARLVSRTSKMDHITPVLVRLHWLPVRAWVEYKVALMTYKCLFQPVPSYLRDRVILQEGLLDLLHMICAG